MYDFEVGDSLYYQWDWYYSGSTQYRDYLWIITDKNYNNDSSSVSYQYFSHSRRYAMYSPTQISSGFSNVTYVDLDSTYMEGFPSDANLFDSSVYTSLDIYKKMNYDSTNNFWRVDSSYNSFGYAYDNNVWNVFRLYNAKGLGITQIAEGREFDNQSRSTRLIAYHKANGKKWGTINTKDFISSVEENVYSQLKIYPNPVSDVLNIEHLELTASGIATIYCLDGVPVQKQTIEQGKNQIEVSSLASGIYFLLIQTNEGAVQQRIVKF